MFCASTHRIAQLAAFMFERLDLLACLSRRTRGDAVAVGAEHRATILSENLSLESVDGIGRVHAAEVRREHVGVGLLTPLGSVRVRPGHGHTLLLRVLGSEEEKWAGRHNAERSLRHRALDACHDLRRARLVIDHQGYELVSVHASIGILKCDTRQEASGIRSRLRGTGAGERRHERQCDGRRGRRRWRRTRTQCSEDGRQDGRHEHRISDSPLHLSNPPVSSKEHLRRCVT